MIIHGKAKPVPSIDRKFPARNSRVLPESRGLISPLLWLGMGRITRIDGRWRWERRPGDAWSYFNGAADFSQMIPEGQRRRLLALSKVGIKLNLAAQGNASTHALSLTRLWVADRLCERDDIRSGGQCNEKHPIVIGQDQILPVHRPISYGRTLQRAVRT